jgi:ketosteroid isomerase-like protein
VQPAVPRIDPIEITESSRIHCADPAMGLLHGLRQPSPSAGQRNGAAPMSITTSTMTDERRRSIAIEFLKRVDRGEDVLDLFADDAQLYFPKNPLANGIDEIKQTFGNVGGTIAAVRHDYAYLNFVHSGDTLVVEATSSGRTADGAEWRAGVTLNGRSCNVFEIRDDKIQRLFVYLDPDWADADTARYPWLRHA